MKINQAGIDLIKSFEGLKLNSYYCPSGVLTIGYGTTGNRVRKGMAITQGEAERFLAEDLVDFEQVVSQLVRVPLNENQFSALVSFAYNCGAEALRTSTALKRLNLGDYAGCCEALQWWTKGNGGIVLPGLVRRRQAEVELFNTPVQERSLKSAPRNSVMEESVEQVEQLQGGRCDIKIWKDTYFVQSPAIAPDLLPEEQKIFLPAGTVLPVLAWREIANNYLVITLNNVVLKGRNTWHCSLDEVKMRLPPTDKPKIIQPAAVPTVRRHELVFTMQLRQANELLTGTLYLYYPDGTVIEYLATSGCRGWQSPESQWAIARGPLPERSDYWIPTTPYWVGTKGVEGFFFHIQPDPVVSPKGVKRGEFGVHFDANSPGSAGCIVLRNKGGFEGFCDRMKLLAESGVSRLPLTVNYV